MMRRTMIFILCAIGIGCAASATETLTPSVFERDIAISNYGFTANQIIAADTGGSEFDENGKTGSALGSKSPGKAFIYSLLVPGAGQMYYGSKVKAVGFFGIEVASWVLWAKFHSDGESMTDDFNAFQEAHWSEARYTHYLQWTYEADDDEDINVFDHPEISHNLPDTKTQQYYEMTGKYNQFAWGWDDARLNGRGLEDVAPPDSNPYTSSDPPPPAINTNVPYSSNRLIYEDMRHDANTKFDHARKMLVVVGVNHVLSAFEAFISAKNHNKHLTKTEGFGRLDVKASLKSVYARRDTPYVTFKYRF